MRSTFSSLWILALLSGCGGEAPRAAPTPVVSNAVVVCLDTVRYDAFTTPERTGRGDALSPWLDRAVRFERVQAPSPWTVPSVASALTGLYPPRHGAGRFSEPIADLASSIPRPMSPEAATLAESLTAAGASTSAIVAHPWFTSGYGLDRGFESVEKRGGREAILRSAKRWLTTAESPFLLYLHFMEAHERHRRPLPEVDAAIGALGHWQPSAGSAPDSVCARPESEDCRRYGAYLSAVLDLRESVASLLAALETGGLLEDTVVLVYSDHGEEFGEHRAEEAAIGGDPRGLYGVGHGHALYQELLHVPLVVWHPHLEGQSVARRAGLIDIAPSIESWLGVERPVSERAGLSLGALIAETAPRRDSRRLFSSFIAYGPEQIAVLAGDEKVVLDTARGVGRAFDLGSDPLEKKPAPASERMTRLLESHLDLAPLAGEEAPPELSEEALEELRALGYLDGGGAER